MLNRVRVEASARTEEGVKDDLASAVSLVQTTYGGTWMETDTSLQTTHKGYWGRVTIELGDSA